MPVLRSRTAGGRARPAVGCALVMARAKRSLAASDRSVSRRSGRPAQAAHDIITTSTTPEGANHVRICTLPG